jgi:hypothetical protein
MIYLNVKKLAPKRQVQNNAILILEIFSMAQTPLEGIAPQRVWFSGCKLDDLAVQLREQ